jgi:hypothetical protein
LERGNRKDIIRNEQRKNEQAFRFVIGTEQFNKRPAYHTRYKKALQGINRPFEQKTKCKDGTQQQIIGIKRQPVAQISQSGYNSIFFIPADSLLVIIQRIINIIFPYPSAQAHNKKRNNKRYLPFAQTVNTGHYPIERLPEPLPENSPIQQRYAQRQSKKILIGRQPERPKRQRYYQKTHAEQQRIQIVVSFFPMTQPVIQGNKHIPKTEKHDKNDKPRQNKCNHT